jgi:hypothetical protein
MLHMCLIFNPIDEERTAQPKKHIIDNDTLRTRSKPITLENWRMQRMHRIGQKSQTRCEPKGLSPKDGRAGVRRALVSVRFGSVRVQHSTCSDTRH